MTAPPTSPTILAHLLQPEEVAALVDSARTANEAAAKLADVRKAIANNDRDTAAWRVSAQRTEVDEARRAIQRLKGEDVTPPPAGHGQALASLNATGSGLRILLRSAEMDLHHARSQLRSLALAVLRAVAVRATDAYTEAALVVKENHRAVGTILAILNPNDPELLIDCERWAGLTIPGAPRGSTAATLARASTDDGYSLAGPLVYDGNANAAAIRTLSASRAAAELAAICDRDPLNLRD